MVVLKPAARLRAMNFALSRPENFKSFFFEHKIWMHRVEQNQKVESFLHWLVTNIPECDITKGEQFAEYIGSGAPKDTGILL